MGAIILRKLFFQVLLLVAIAISVYFVANIGLTYRAKSTARLEQLWSQDIHNLQSINKLPVSWNDIRLVEKIPSNDDALASLWTKSVSPPIEINPNGTHKLEILFISQKSEDGHTQAVIMHHITNAETRNLEWELGRTYTLD